MLAACWPPSALPLGAEPLLFPISVGSISSYADIRLEVVLLGQTEPRNRRCDELAEAEAAREAELSCWRGHTPKIKDTSGVGIALH